MFAQLETHLSRPTESTAVSDPTPDEALVIARDLENSSDRPCSEGGQLRSKTRRRMVAVLGHGFELIWGASRRTHALRL